MSARGRGARPVAGAALIPPLLLALLFAAESPDLRDGLEDDAREFWLGSAEERTAARERLLESDASFEELYEALAAEPGYPADVPVGRIECQRVDGEGVLHPYTVFIPESYDSDRGYPVLVALHGGVNRGAWREPGGWVGGLDRLASDGRILVVPAAWSESPWWRGRQIENLAAIVAELGRRYRIDRNRVHLLGASDGATGVYYQAFRAATPWASFIALIGHPAVLSSPRLRVEGQMYVGNLRNRPLFVVNGGRDRLYPTSSVEPFVRLFEEHGVRLVYRPQPEGGHDLTWWPSEAARVDSFMAASPRDPLPESLEWESEDPSRGRFSWVVIDELGSVPGEADLPDRNALRVGGDSTSYLAFPHRRPSGRVVAERRGNRVTVGTRGVRSFRILISPEVFDLSDPIRIDVNGRTAFEGTLTPDRETLLDRAARDRDRTMLFAAEVRIEP